MPITTLTDLRNKAEKALPAFSGTGASGATIASSQLSNHQLSTPEAPKMAQGTQKLYVHGDSIKCNIVNGPVTNQGEIRFVGKTKSSAQQPRVMPNVGADTGAAVTVAGSMKLTMVCESLITNGITFGEDDDEDL